MRAGDDVDKLGWFSLGADWSKFAFPADRHVVERYFATRFSGAPVDLAFAGETCEHNCSGGRGYPRSES
jgi:hypothetical protein